MAITIEGRDQEPDKRPYPTHISCPQIRLEAQGVSGQGKLARDSVTQEFFLSAYRLTGTISEYFLIHK